MWRRNGSRLDFLNVWGKGRPNMNLPFFYFSGIAMREILAYRKNNQEGSVDDN
jgi:hypothetical protein